MSDPLENERTAEERDAAIWRHEKAQKALDAVLMTISKLDNADAQAVMDTAQRIMRLALKAQHLGPFALTLAGAQMAADLQPHPDADKPVQEPSRIILPPGTIIQ